MSSTIADMITFLAPKYLTAINMNETITLITRILDPTDQKLACDGSHLKFVDPVGLCLVALLGERLRQDGREVILKGFPENVLAYLSRMDSLKGAFSYPNVSSGLRRDRRADLLEVQTISDSRDVDNVANRLVCALMGRLPNVPGDTEPDEMTGLTPADELEIPLRYIFTELLDNFFHHARAYGHGDAKSWVSAQYIKSSDLIRLAIVDDGCGFLRSLENHPELRRHDDIHAIRLALHEGISGHPAVLLMGHDHAANQGVGLTVVNKLVQRAAGCCWICSGQAIAEIDNSGSLKTKTCAGWQGSMIAIQLRRSCLPGAQPQQIIAGLRGIKDSGASPLFT